MGVDGPADGGGCTVVDGIKFDEHSAGSFGRKVVFRTVAPH